MKRKGIGTILVSLLMVTTILAGCSSPQSQDTSTLDPSESVVTLASCLQEKGLKMYGAERCSHCKKMKNMFGSAFEKITYIDCDKQKAQCDAAGIEGFPTRSYQGQKYPGEKTFQELATMTGCPYTP